MALLAVALTPRDAQPAVRTGYSLRATTALCQDITGAVDAGAALRSYHKANGLPPGAEAPAATVPRLQASGFAKRRMTDRGPAALKAREAVRLTAYLDSVGVWTIGVDHTAAAGEPIPRKGLTISAKDQAWPLPPLCRPAGVKSRCDHTCRRHRQRYPKRRAACFGFRSGSDVSPACTRHTALVTRRSS